MGSLLPDSINVPHLQAFDDMMSSRYAAQDFSPFFIFMIDTVPAIALPYIAENFDMLGFKGWKFAITEAQQRALLKGALKMRRKIGTPWSIKQALLLALNITDCQFIEGYNLFYDNEVFYNGALTYGSSGSWAEFRAIINSSNFSVIDQTTIDDIIGIISAWKPVRSHLVDVSFSYNGTDPLTITDSITMTIQNISNPSLDIIVTF